MGNSLKFDDICVNTDNFVQNGETMQELTVTITLSEYRRLLAESFELKKLENKVEELNGINQACITYLSKKHPEFTENFNVCLNKIIEDFRGNKENKVND